MNVEATKAELTKFIDSYAKDEVNEFTLIQKEQMLKTLENYICEVIEDGEEISEALELIEEIHNFIEYFTSYDDLREKMFAYANNYILAK